jgi:hypothetical protein
MAYANINLTIETKAASFDIEVVAEGEIVTGGSNRYGSDEPAYCEVQDMRVYRKDFSPLPPMLRDHILDQYDDILTDHIVHA